MAAFDPATVARLRELLRDTNAQHKRDLTRRSKLPANSKSLMAQRLDSRIGSAMRVARDLEWLLPADADTPPTELQTAYRVLGHVMDTVPSDFAACGWDIEIRHSTGPCIMIQQSGMHGRNDAARQGIRSVATVLGLIYAEERRDERTLIHAAGEIDGVSIQVWDIVDKDGAS